jgi:DNA repair protein RadA/Sms
MVAKARSVYFCSACGFESTRWLGRCPQCETWNSFDERPFSVVESRGSKAGPRTRAGVAGHAGAKNGGAVGNGLAGVVPVPLQAIESSRIARIQTGLREFDAVLGGGIVPGSLTLVGGPPGAGKSTLMLQIAATLAENYASAENAASGAPVVYVCGEESAAQVKLRAARLNVTSDPLIFAETNLHAVLDKVEEIGPAALIVDSIQTVWLPESESYAGSVAQVRDCTQALMEFSKRTGCATFIVGHVTKDGAIAGPRLLEHLVDTVLYFEGENTGEYRILRAYKNRFGSIDEICVFGMHDNGLREVANPSELFLSHRSAKPSGSCVVASIVGSRPVLIEVQALVGETSYGTPRRLANNLDQARLAMILAVLERRVGLQLGSHDVYASVAGGLRVNEPAADLGIALAIASSFRNVPLAPDAAAYGELGLSGELRAVSASTRRDAEARKLGYKTIYSPANCPDIAQAIEKALQR